MNAEPSEAKLTHAELAAKIPPAPPDEENEAIVFAKKTFRWTVILAVAFIAVAVVILL